jgi:hypothetical protein
VLGALVATAAAVASACPPVSTAPQLPVRPGGIVLRGDVDGDGLRDVVSIRMAGAARMTCGFFLVVRSRRTRLAVRVPELYKPPNDWSSAEFARWADEPYLLGLVALEPKGLGVLVARSHGASTSEATLFVVRATQLVAVRVPFEFGGSVGTAVTQADCLRPRTRALVLTWVELWRWRFHREVDRLEGTRLRRLRSRSFAVPATRGQRLMTRWHVSGSPFPSCTTVRGRRY